MRVDKRDEFLKCVWLAVFPPGQKQRDFARVGFHASLQNAFAQQLNTPLLKNVGFVGTEF
jgi:hypothetical protein